MKHGWEYKKLGDIISPAKSERYGDRDSLPILSITMREGIVHQTERFKKVIASRETSGYKVIKRGQLVIAFPIDEGLIYIQNVADEGIMSPAYNVWDVNYNLLNGRFLEMYLHSKEMFHYYKEKLRGTTQRRRMLPKEDLLAISIPVPALAVQERIVGELDKVREVIEKKKEQMKELERLAGAMFYDMFGDPVENEKGWEVKTFGEVGELIRGGGFLKSDFVESGVPCIHYGQIHMKFGQFIKEHLTEIPASVAAKSKIASKGDVVIAITSEDVEGSCKCTAWMGDYDIFVGAHAAIYKHNQNPIYVSYYIKSSGFQIAKQKYVHGIKVMEIKPSDISKIDILLPPLSLQQAFAEKIEVIEKQKELITASIKEAERLFDSRMEYWFGK